MGDAFVRRRRRLLSLEGGENGAGQDTGSGDDPPGDGGGGRGGLLGGGVGGGVGGDGRLGAPGGLLVLLGLGLGRRGRRRRRGRGRLGAEQLVGERHLVDGVDGEGEVLADDGGEQRPVDAGGDVDVVVRRLDLVLVRAVGAGRLRVHGAAEGGEHGEAVEPREHAVEHQLDLVLRRQRVERARRERRERGVRGREHGQPVVAVHQLAVDLGVHPALVEEPEEGGVLAGLLQHCRHVRRRGAVGRRRRGAGRRRRGLRRRGGLRLLRRRQHRRRGEQRGEEEEAGGRHWWVGGCGREESDERWWRRRSESWEQCVFNRLIVWLVARESVCVSECE